MKLICAFLLFVTLWSESFALQGNRLRTKIRGGQEANPNDFPYVVSIKKDFYNLEHKCEGTILSTSYILTLASCFDDFHFSDFWVVAGDHNLQQVDGFEEYVRISELKIHHNYPDIVEFDIALAKLNKPLDFNERINSISLPAVLDQEYNGTALVSAWGLSNDRTSNVLRFLEIPLLSDDECQGLEGIELQPVSQLCAGSARRANPCSGDSGAALVKNNTLIGLAIWSPNAKECNYPWVYTQVSHFIRWINDNMPNN